MFLLDAVVALQAVIFVILFILSQQNNLREYVLDIQLHREISDLLLVAGKKGWLFADNCESKLSELAGKPIYINRDPGVDMVCEHWTEFGANETRTVTACVLR